LIGVLERFCSGFADRDAEAVMQLVDPGPDIVVVTSEESLLRGPVELRRFLDRYVEGATTYSWEWDRYDIATAGSVGWLLAEGTETATTGGRVEKHAYRMTMVLARDGDRWLLTQVHGSSPH
jgi:ketosteroid isomerase-like protein